MKKTTPVAVKKDRRPLIAAVLNGVLPGLGYLYLDKRKLFAVLVLIGHVLFWAVDFGGFPGSNGDFVEIGNLLIRIGFIVDAYQLAKE